MWNLSSPRQPIRCGHVLFGHKVYILQIHFAGYYWGLCQQCMHVKEELRGVLCKDGGNEEVSTLICTSLFKGRRDEIVE